MKYCNEQYQQPIFHFLLCLKVMKKATLKSLIYEKELIVYKEVCKIKTSLFFNSKTKIKCFSGSSIFKCVVYKSISHFLLIFLEILRFLYNNMNYFLFQNWWLKVLKMACLLSFFDMGFDKGFWRVKVLK